MNQLHCPNCNHLRTMFEVAHRICWNCKSLFTRPANTPTL